MRTKTLAQAEKILQAAARLFSRRRFHEVRMEDLAAAAGVGKGTLYRYFADKEKLYVALLGRASEAMVQRLQAAAESRATPRRRLEAIAAAVITFFDDEPHVIDLIQHVELHHETDVDFPWQHAREVGTQLVQEVFAAARRQGEFSVRDAELAGLMFWGGLRAVIRFGTRPRRRDLARRFVAEFLNGVDQSSTRPSRTTRSASA